ncbi:MAG: PQQ-binding-like beta-propeller repeat protein [Saprospiraceae bacterium]
MKSFNYFSIVVNSLVIFFFFFLFSCEKECIPNDFPVQPTKRVSWGWQADLSNFSNELQRNPVIYKNWIIIGFATDLENKNNPSVLAFNKTNGTLEWQYTHPVYPTNMLRNVKVYSHYLILKYQNSIVCLNADTREIIWDKSYGPQVRSEVPIEIYGEYIYQAEEFFDDIRNYPFNNSTSLVRYHIPTGVQEKLFGEEMVINSGDHPILYPPVVYQDTGRELVIFSRYYLSLNTHKPVDMFAIDTQTKELVWKDTSYSHLSDAWNTAPFIFEGDVIGSSDYTVYSWDATTGLLNWSTELTGLNQKAGFTFSGPFLHDRKIFAISNEGKMFCLDAKSGSLLWQNIMVGVNENGPARGPCNRPIIVDDILYVNTWSDQAFILFDANTGKQLERYRDADYNGRNVLYDEETKTFFVTTDDQLRAFTVKR